MSFMDFFKVVVLGILLVSCVGFAFRLPVNWEDQHRERVIYMGDFELMAGDVDTACTNPGELFAEQKDVYHVWLTGFGDGLAMVSCSLFVIPATGSPDTILVSVPPTSTSNPVVIFDSDLPPGYKGVGIKQVTISNGMYWFTVLAED